jgi:hypothetical protein
LFYLVECILADRSSDDPNEFERKAEAAATLKEQYRKQAPQITNRPPSKFVLPPRINWIWQFLILLERSFFQVIRSYLLWAILILQPIIMGLLVGLTYEGTNNVWPVVDRKRGLLYFLVSNQGIFGLILMVNLCKY